MIMEHLGQPGLIFSQSDWDKSYTKEEYNQKPRIQRVTQHIFHYLLAFDQPAEFINQQIPKLAKLIPNQDEECHLLTALHIAVMKVKPAVVEAFLKTSEGISCLNVPDEYGWTPLHHAVICSKAIYEMLLTAGADVKALTETGADVAELEILIGRVKSNHSMQHVYVDLPSCPMTKLSSLSAEKMKELTGLLLYTDRALYPKDSYQKLWQQLPLVNPVHAMNFRFAKKAYEQLKKSPPELVVRECASLKGKASLVLELATLKPIRKGDGIGLYSGLVKNSSNFVSRTVQHFSPPFSTDYFSLESTDARDAGHAIRWANDGGLPNAFMIDLGEHVDNAERNLLVAMTDIPAGKPIHWSYGLFCTDFIFNKQLLIDRSAARLFFQKGLSPLFEELRIKRLVTEAIIKRKLDKTSDTVFFEFHVFQHLLLSPLQSPATLLDLHFSGIALINEWLIQCKTMDSTDQSFATGSKVFKLVIEFMENVKAFDTVLLTHPEERKLITAFVLSALEDLSPMQILKTLQMVSQELPKGQIENLNAYLLAKKQSLKNYNFLEDKEAPLKIDPQDDTDSVKELKEITDAIKEILNASLFPSTGPSGSGSRALAELLESNRHPGK